MQAVDRLVAYWRDLDLSAPPFVHPADQSALLSFPEFDQNAIPYPYVGDIREADVWVLMLNSNIAATDKEHEAQPYLRARLQANLRQELSQYEHPLLCLDPALKHTGTYEYYNRRNGLAKVIAAYAKQTNIGEAAARSEVSRRLAILQLFPYRSSVGVAAKLLGDALLSVQYARAAVKESLGERLIIVPRSSRHWGFEYGSHEPGRLLTYKADQARTASLIPGGAGGGGDEILTRLLKQ